MEEVDEYHYILDGHTPRVASDLNAWAVWFKTYPNRTVARTEIDGVEVSMVFLGLNHQFSRGGPPLLFETMIFGGEHDEYQERYSTWDEAEAGHARAIELAEAKASV